MKTINLLDIFTLKELKELKKLKEAKNILPLLDDCMMKRINKATKQENDSRYWSYLLEFYLNKLDI